MILSHSSDPRGCWMAVEKVKKQSLLHIYTHTHPCGCGHDIHMSMENLAGPGLLRD